MGTTFDRCAGVIKLGIYEVIELDISYKYFGVCNDGKVEGLVKVVPYGTSSSLG